MTDQQSNADEFAEDAYGPEVDLPIIDDPKTTCVATADGAVYYDMAALTETIAAALLPKVLLARLTGDETEMARCQGAKWVIDSIEASRKTLAEKSSIQQAFNLPDAVDPFDAPGGGNE